MSKEWLQQEIIRLKQERQAVVLAHYYQIPEIQEVADMTGDSLEMARYAARIQNAQVIVVCGVRFMAETAKILNPLRKVLIPEPEAGCSLADSITPEQLRNFICQHPGVPVISYINCSAEIKAMSDAVCTSSNAVQVVKAVAGNGPAIFVPDINLGKYVQQQTGCELILWNGACIVHENFSMDKILHLHKEHPHAKFIAHPESQPHILRIASYIGSTKGMIDFITRDDAKAYIVATEAGILHQMRLQAPHKTLIPAPAYEDNACACSECPYMKMNTLEKLHRSLNEEVYEINLPHEVIHKAALALNRMLNLTDQPSASQFVIKKPAT
jgi:quinolinate synthase